MWSYACRCVTFSFLLAGCLTSGSGALTQQQLDSFNENVQFVLKSDGTYEFTSSGYPSHDIDNSVNPNDATVQNFNYSIPVSPSTGGKHCTALGPIGFAINGVAIYNALTGDTTDAVIHEIFDDCKGHSSPDGAYHYHQFSGCIAGSIEVEDQLLGIALDGHPIYGPKTSDKTELLTSADLDACHGRMVNGAYRYHITEDFPYALGCYVSQPGSSNTGGTGGPPSGGGGRPPPRGKRQIDTSTVTCANTEGGAQLCDCNNAATYQACDVAVAGGNCNDGGQGQGDGTNNPPVEGDSESTPVPRSSPPQSSTTANNNEGSSRIGDTQRPTTTYDGNASSRAICTGALLLIAQILALRLYMDMTCS